jgi:transposase
VLVPPTFVDHNGSALDGAVATLKEAVKSHDIRDVLVAVERTGRYHHAAQRAFAAGGFDVRTVHPLISKHFRQLSDPGVKTDDKDLAGICLGAINGFALAEPKVDLLWRQLQLLTRHRRDLVRKASTLCCQIKEHLESALPGYAACFPTFWDNRAALTLALRMGLAELQRTSRAKLKAMLDKANIRYRDCTLDHVIQWAANAGEPDLAALYHQQIAAELESDRQQKERQIQQLERQIASLLVRTAYVLLLSIPGINVVCAGEYAAEMGPICNYANARRITGRAGLYPSRYQSDKVDHTGRLVRCANRRLRFALLQIADCLVNCNHYFKRLAASWRTSGADPRLVRVRVGNRFARISLQMVAGGKVFAHPAAQGRDYVLQKLIDFHHRHQTPPLQVQQELQQAIRQLPPGEHAAEAQPLQEQLNKIQQSSRQPQPLGELLATVLAALGVTGIQSPSSGSSDPA